MLLTNADHLSEYWSNNLNARIDQKLPELPDSEVIPVFLQIDTQDFDVESFVVTATVTIARFFKITPTEATMFNVAEVPVSSTVIASGG